MTPAAFVRDLRDSLERHRNPAKAAPMQRYLRDQFPFLGLQRPQWSALIKPLQAGFRAMTESSQLDIARRLWHLPEREYTYVTMALLSRAQLSHQSLPTLRELIETRPWWDSVDGIVCHVLGPLILRERQLQKQMDRWSSHCNFWLRRAAILHQLGFKQQTDTARLFGYCARNAHDQEFFIRKAIGWALRTYAYSDPAAVRSFVHTHVELSPLSRREALKRMRN